MQTYFYKLANAFSVCYSRFNVRNFVSSLSFLFAALSHDTLAEPLYADMSLQTLLAHDAGFDAVKEVSGLFDDVLEFTELIVLHFIVHFVTSLKHLSNRFNLTASISNFAAAKLHLSLPVFCLSLRAALLCCCWAIPTR